MVTGIIWLASYPKSGNTWLRLFMENLFRNSMRPVPINELNVVKHGDSAFSVYEKVAGRPLSGASDAELNALREPVQRYLASGPETTFVKTHNALVRHEGLPLIRLEHTVGAVYLLRNPFDLAVSFADHFRISHDEAIEAIASSSHHTKTTPSAICQFLGGWTNHYRSWFGVDNFDPLFIRYEDMIRDPVKSFGRFMRYLGLPKNPERLKRAIRHSTFSEVERQEKEVGFRERAHQGQKFFRTGKTGGYENVLSEQQIGRIIDAHGDLLFEQKYISKDGRPRV
jgi:hypothetical protein